MKNHEKQDLAEIGSTVHMGGETHFRALFLACLRRTQFGLPRCLCEQRIADLPTMIFVHCCRMLADDCVDQYWLCIQFTSCAPSLSVMGLVLRSCKHCC